MEDEQIRQEIVAELYNRYQANGFITEEEALTCFAVYNLPLYEIDSLTEHLLTLGVIIKLEEDDEEDDQHITDRSKLNYNEIFNEVLFLEPNLHGFIEYIRNITPPRHREWQNLLPQAQNGNDFAFDRLVEMYLKTVVKQALYLSKKHHLPLEDTIQDGIVGLIISIKKFNLFEHDKFSTYAPWWITQTINRLKRIPGNPMYFPVHMKDNLFMIQDVIEEHICKYCPKDENNICQKLLQQLCEKYGWTIDDAAAYVLHYKQWSSLDDILEESNDKFNDKGMFETELIDNIDSDYIVKTYMEYLNKFELRERQVLLLRYGFTKKGEMTLEEVGKIFGVTRERVRQIENKAIQRLRSATEKALKKRKREQGI